MVHLILSITRSYWAQVAVWSAASITSNASYPRSQVGPMRKMKRTTKIWTVMLHNYDSMHFLQNVNKNRDITYFAFCPPFVRSDFTHQRTWSFSLGDKFINMGQHFCCHYIGTYFCVLSHLRSCVAMSSSFLAEFSQSRRSLLAIIQWFSICWKVGP